MKEADSIRDAIFPLPDNNTMFHWETQLTFLLILTVLKSFPQVLVVQALANEDETVGPSLSLSPEHCWGKFTVPQHTDALEYELPGIIVNGQDTFVTVQIFSSHVFNKFFNPTIQEHNIEFSFNLTAT